MPWLASFLLVFSLACSSAQPAPSAPSAAPVSAVAAAAIEAASAVDFETTLSRLVAAIDSRGFKTFAIIDHAAGANSVDLVLPAATEVIFGNPVGGTPLMQADIRLGLELPLRVLVFQSEDEVKIRYPDYPAIGKRYGVAGQDTRLAKIAGALAAIAKEAGAP